MISPSPSAHQRTTSAVQIGYVGASEGDHHRLVGVAGVPPIGDQASAHLISGLAGHDSAVALVIAQRRFYLAAAEQRERVAFPAGLLAPVLAELNRRQASDQGPERAAGADLGQLVFVADQHQLRPRTSRMVGQLRELASGNHPGLVDDEHGAPWKSCHRPRPKPLEQGGDAGARNAGAVL